MKKIVVKIVGVLIVAIILVQNTVVIAASQSQLNNQKDQNNEKIGEYKDQQKEIEAQKSKTVKEVEDISSKIDEYENQIAELDGKIGTLNSQIEESQNNLNKAQEDFDKQEKLMEARLVAVQEQGDTSFLDVLLSSENIVDLISRYYFVTELVSADTELLEGIKKQKEEIQRAKEKLEASKKELDTAKASKQGISTQLKTAKSQKDQQVAQLSEDEKALQAKIDELNQSNKEIDKKIQEEIRKAQEEANKNNGTGNSGGNVQISSPSAAGFILPIPVAYKSPITAKMYYPSSGRYHGAYDFGAGGINGQPVFAVADGTVVISENLGNRSYGNYILINHNNGLFTLYAHGQDGSRMVSAGQKVKQGQQIMRVGNTGNSSGPHLHFEVGKYPGTSANRVDPGPYLPL